MHIHSATVPQFVNFCYIYQPALFQFHLSILSKQEPLLLLYATFECHHNPFGVLSCMQIQETFSVSVNRGKNHLYHIMINTTSNKGKKLCIM